MAKTFRDKSTFLKYLADSDDVLNDDIVFNFSERLTVEEIEPHWGKVLFVTTVLIHCDITEKFFDKHFSELVNVEEVFVYNKFSESFLEKCIPYFDEHQLTTMSYDQTLSEAFIEKYADKVCWMYIFGRQKLSIPFIEKWYSNIKNNPFKYNCDNFNIIDSWNNILRYQDLDLAFVKKYFDKINWNELSSNLTLEIAREYGNFIKWNEACFSRRISKEFVDEFSDRLDLKTVILLHDFGEAFLEKHIKKIGLNNILRTQGVSLDFILRHSKKLTKFGKKLILKNKKIKKDMEFYEKVGHLFEFSSVPYNEDVLREIVKKNIHKFDVNQFIAGGDLGCLRQVCKFLVD